MISRIHQKLGTAGFIISIVALVAALGGGAYAASGGLNGKQKKEVEKIAKKYAGKPGAPGATGPEGKQGSAGPAGSKGDTGATGNTGEKGAIGVVGPQGSQGGQGNPGADGKNVVTASFSGAQGGCQEGGATVEVEGEASTKKYICNGTNGTNGTTILNGTGAPSPGLGSNGDFYIDTAALEIYGPKTAGGWGSGTPLSGGGGGLPSTMTGVWSASGASHSTELHEVSISYLRPIAQVPKLVFVPESYEGGAIVNPELGTGRFLIEAEEFEPYCGTGTYEEPTAEPGYLCVYQETAEGGEPAEFGPFFSGDETEEAPNWVSPDAHSGAMFPISFEFGGTVAKGTWALTE